MYNRILIVFVETEKRKGEGVHFVVGLATGP
jgi:hypothetical protein